MSEEVKVVKKRGRPKKATEVDTIVLIESPVDTSTQPSKSAKARSTIKRSAVQASDIVSTSQNRGKRKVVDEIVETATTARPRRSAKKIDKEILALENIITKPEDGTSSSILESATAFQQVRDSDAASGNKSKLLQAAERVSSPTTTSLQQESTAAVNTAIHHNQHKLDKLNDDFGSLANNLRRLSIDRVGLSLLHFSNATRQLKDSILSLRAELDRQAQFTSYTLSFQNQIAVVEGSLQNVKFQLIQIHHDQLTTRLHLAGSGVQNIATNIQQAAGEIHSLSSAIGNELSRRTLMTNLTNKVQLLIHDITETATSIQTLQPNATEAQSRDQTLPKTLPTSTTTTITHPQSTITSDTTPINTSTVEMSSPTKPNTPQPPQQQQRVQTPLRTMSPPNPSSQPTQTARPHPTTLPYEKLIKDPRFKAKSREWLGLIIGIPVLITTSWVLYKRHQGTLAKLEADRRGRERGVLGSTSGFGVDSRSSDVGHNGGV